jgi:colanic acid/amylovoran biosynthesis protein
MKKIALLGNGPILNSGCEAIVLGTKLIIEQEFGPVDFYLASFANDAKSLLPPNIHPISLPYSYPRWSKSWWKYKVNRSLGRPEDKTSVLKQIKKTIWDSSIALSIGGDGYSIDYGHMIIDRLVIMDNYAKSIGLPVIIWGASIGPFDKEPEFERQMIEHFNKIDLIMVREISSLKYLSDLGIKNNVKLAPDPAFVIEPKPCHLPINIEKFLENPCIGINLSPLLAKYATDGDLHLWLNKSVEIINHIINEFGLPILLIPHVTHQSKNPNQDDRIFLLRLLDNLPPKLAGMVMIVPESLNCENLKWIIGRTTIFVGARTHSTISALSSCVPCISIAYSVKAWGINEYVFNHRNWVVSSTNLTTDSLCDRIGGLLEEKEYVRDYLQQRIPAMIVEAFNAGRDLGVIVSQERRQIGSH